MSDKIDIYESTEIFNEKKYENIFLVDILRASTTGVLLYNKGIKKICFEDDLRMAIKKAKELNALLLGEINGKKPRVFDLGNSPFEISRVKIIKDRAVHFTTNGTPLFKKFTGNDHTYLASFLNIGNVIEKINGNTAFILAGTNGKPAYEDRFFAGYVLTLFPKCYWGHGALPSARLYERFKYAPEYFFCLTKNGKNLVNIGKFYDIKFALQKNICPILPNV
ncbi:2-phosphosulfolactate phosphatase [bacterium]|nr:2-phosphosulfolactate phosphatase [bacterium]